MNDKMVTIVCFGDSNTHGYNPTDGSRFPREIRWTGRLQQLLGKDYFVVEEGCNGRTTVYGDIEEGWINGMAYLRPCLYSHRMVDYVVMMLGTNDLKESFGASAETIGQGMERLVCETKSFMEEHQGQAPRIILIAPPVLGDRMSESIFADEFTPDSVKKSKELAVIYEKIASRCQCTFLNAADFATVSEEDSLHLGAESHASFATKVYECIQSLQSQN